MESETAPTTTDYNEALFSNTDNVLKRYFQIQTTVSINCTNCQKIDRGDATSRLIRFCQIDHDWHGNLMNLDRGDGGLMLSTPRRGVQKLVKYLLALIGMVGA